jgi:hypothetical protein
MSERLRIKCGEVELDYEGDLVFQKADLLEWIEKLSNLSATVERSSTDKGVHPVDRGGAKASLSKVESVSDIARKLSVTTGPDLVLAASAALHFLHGKAEFTSREITASMREAKHFFKPSYVNNQSIALERLVKKGAMRLLGGDRYALSHETIEELKNSLA